MHREVRSSALQVFRNLGITHKSVYKAATLLIASAALWSPSTCFAGKVQVWTDKNVNFANYKTYEWLPPKLLTRTGIVENDAEFSAVIEDAVNRQLTQKGLTQVERGGDLQISVLALTQPIPQLEGFIFAGPTPDFFTAPIATVGRYNHEGTLIVNLIDTRTQKSAWCGMAKESVDNKPGAGKKKIAPAATKLFKKYPKAREGN